MRILYGCLMSLIILSYIAGCSVERKPGAPQKPERRLPVSSPNADVAANFGSGGVILVTLSDVDKLALIDLISFELGDIVDTGEYPVEAVFAPDGSKFYVLMATRIGKPVLDDDTPPNTLNENSVWSWDASNYQIRSKASIITGEDPAFCSALAINSSGRHIFIADSENNEIIIRETAGGQNKIATIPVGFNPEKIVICPDDRYLVTMNTGNDPDHESGTVSVIYQLSNEEIHRLPVGGKPYSGYFNKSNDKLYVTVSDSNEIKEINYRDGNVDRSYSVGAGPRGITGSIDGKTLYITCFDENVIYSLDIDTGETKSLFSTGNGPSDLTIDKSGHILMVANEQDKTLSIINIPQEKTVSTIDLKGIPTSIALWTPIAERDRASAQGRTADDIRGLLTPTGVTEASPGTVDPNR